MESTRVRMYVFGCTSICPETTYPKLESQRVHLFPKLLIIIIMWTIIKWVWLYHTNPTIGITCVHILTDELIAKSFKRRRKCNLLCSFLLLSHGHSSCTGSGLSFLGVSRLLFDWLFLVACSTFIFLSFLFCWLLVSCLEDLFLQLILALITLATGWYSVCWTCSV